MPRLVEHRAQNGAPAAQRLRRVVVTGMGLVTPLGTGVEKNWTALMAGRSGIGPITRFTASDFPTRIAGEVTDFAAEDYIERREIKKMDPFIQYAVAASQQAVDQAGLRIPPETADRYGTIVGVGMGGLLSIEQFHTLYLESRLRRVSPFFIAKVIPNLAAGQISIRFGARGVNYTPASACASGATAVGEGFRNIRHGYQDAVIAGGTEAALCGLGIGGFIAMRALSTRNDAPERASRPFDRGRDGFVVAEGAGIVVLEALEHAEARGARILGEVIGYGANADAFHITAPAPEGEGAVRCMQQTLADAALAPTDVDYINAHGTATQYNDASESEAIHRVFGEHAKKLAESSTKSMIGHTLGAAGGIEAIYTVLALERGRLPPTINYEEPDPACDLDYVPNVARASDARIALSNSFGFGGANACLAVRRWD
jgi:3-oxoacyl-[acyl-carrier-protein] synthase II